MTLLLQRELQCAFFAAENEIENQDPASDTSFSFQTQLSDLLTDEFGSKNVVVSLESICCLSLYLLR